MKSLSDLDHDIVLDIPTYEGSGQAVHPDVYYSPGKKWGHEFWLVCTPYPYSVDWYENPSLFYSCDGVDFKAYKYNPLVGPPKQGFYNDPDLFWNEEENAFHVFFQHGLAPEKQIIKSVILVKGRAPRVKDVMEFQLDNNEPFTLSPALVKNKNKYYLYYVDGSTPYHTIKRTTSKSLMEWDKTNVENCVYELPKDLVPWHVDVIHLKDEIYLMLVNGPVGKGDLYGALSDDLLKWRFMETPLIENDFERFRCKEVYRSSAIVYGEEVVIYYSFQDYFGMWNIGVKKIKLSFFLEYWNR